jgi:hypothetical protein
MATRKFESGEEQKTIDRLLTWGFWLAVLWSLPDESAPVNRPPLFFFEESATIDASSKREPVSFDSPRL